MACDIARHSMQTAVMLVTQQPVSSPRGRPARARDGREARRHRLVAGRPVSAAGRLGGRPHVLRRRDGYYRFGIDLFVAGVEGMLPGGSKTR